MLQWNGALQRDRKLQWDRNCSGINSATVALQRKNIAMRVATIHCSVATNVAMGVAMVCHREWRTKSLWQVPYFIATKLHVGFTIFLFPQQLEKDSFSGLRYTVHVYALQASVEKVTILHQEIGEEMIFLDIYYKHTSG